MNDIFTLSRFFNALGDGTRLHLVALLAQQEPGSALCVGRLARELETTASNISQHLRVLKDLGLVYSERRGNNLHYFLNPDQLGNYRQLISEVLGKQFLPKEAIFTKIEEQKTISKTPDCAHPEKRPGYGDEKQHPCKCDCKGQEDYGNFTSERSRECHGDIEQHPYRACSARCGKNSYQRPRLLEKPQGCSALNWDRA